LNLIFKHIGMDTITFKLEELYVRIKSSITSVVIYLQHSFFWIFLCRFWVIK